MRILFVALPASGHHLPLVPLAWAARLSGHDVLFATDRPNAELIVRAGLPVTQVVDVDALDTCTRDLGLTATDIAGFDLLEAVAHWLASGHLHDDLAAMFALLGDAVLDGVVRAAREWPADVIVYEPFMPIGLLVATAVGIPAVLHGIGMPYPTLTPALSVLSEARARYGVDDVRPPVASIDVWPASMRPSFFDSGWPMRYRPYNGEAVLPRWLHEPPKKHRICIMTGTSIAWLGHMELLDSVVDGVAGMDVEAVVLGAGDRSPDSMPENCRSTGWLPLNAVLRTCSAVIHHGGAGSTCTALNSAVPQLVIPQFADQPGNADAVAERGVGLRLNPNETDTNSVRECLDRLLSDSAFSGAAAEVREEIAAMPTPSNVVERLTALVGSGLASAR